MTVIDNLENFFEETEADVLKVIVAIKQEAEIFASDLSSALKWVASQAPAIATEVEGVLGIVTELGIGSNPTIAAAVTAANVAVTALNAFATASNSGAGTVQAVVDGYVAVKQAQAASASATAAIAAAPPPAKAAS